MSDNPIINILSNAYTRRPGKDKSTVKVKVLVAHVQTDYEPSLTLTHMHELDRPFSVTQFFGSNFFPQVTTSKYMKITPENRLLLKGNQKKYIFR